MFNLLSIGKKAIMLNQNSLDTIGHNIANVNNPEYSRQRVVQTAADPINDALANYGSGVEMVRLERMRDVQLDWQYRNENSKKNYWETLSEKYSQLETIFNEPSDYGLSANLNLFWDKWEELSNNPSSVITRVDLKEAAIRLTNSFHDIDEGLDDQRKALNLEMENFAEEINSITKELATLSKRIQLTEAEGKPANDLLDKFDAKLDKLSEYGDVKLQIREDGYRMVYLGSDEIVDFEGARELTTVYLTEVSKPLANVVFKENYKEINSLKDGKINATLEMRDKIIDNYQKMLDDLAIEITNNINSIHKTGYGLGNPPSNGMDFFWQGTTDAGNFRLSDEIMTSHEFISASLDGEEGDNRIALEISNLRTDATMNTNQSFGNYFGSMMTKLGTDSFNSKKNSTLYTNTTQQTLQFRESVKGVSINEETAELIKYQQAYMASAKIISTADTMFQTVLSLIK
ncbi:MAG: flagellar hook-associated protein FlgK [Candidatus Cloacimonetes bacterium]|nr:flagellar hook-associated protein FlgK [Candidatus Cloacimonadota bacterium]